MGLEILTPQTALASTAVILSLASTAVILSFVGFTGLLVLELQGGPTINSFTVSISDTNKDGAVTQSDMFSFSCSASDSIGLKYISVEQTYPTGGKGWWSPSTPNGYLDNPKNYTFSKNDIGTVLWTPLGKEGGIPGVYTFKCIVTNSNGAKVESEVKSVNVQGCSPSTEGSCKTSDDCTGSGGKWCMGSGSTNSYCDVSGASCTTPSMCGNGVCDKGEGNTYGPTMCSQDCSPSPSPTSSSSICGDNICGQSESKYSCSKDCGIATDKCNSGQGNGVCESGEDYENCWKDCPKGTSPIPSTPTSASMCNGNGVCESGESQTTCSVDCGVSQGYVDGCGTGKCGDGSCNINCNVQEDWANCYKDCPKSGATSTPALGIVASSPKPKVSPTPVQLKPGQPEIKYLDFDKTNAIIGDTVKPSCTADDAEGLKEIKITVTNPSGKATVKTSPFSNVKSGTASITPYKILEKGMYTLECEVADSDNNLQTDVKQIEIGSETPQIIPETKSRLTVSPTILKSEILQMPEFVEKNVPVEVEVSEEVAEKAGATKITIEVLEDVTAASVEIKALGSIPEEDETGQALTELPLAEQPVIKVIQFIPSAELLSSIKQAEIEFTLTDVEMLEGNIVPDEVVLARFEAGIWMELETFYLGRSDDSGNHNFKSITLGFSVFVVTKKASAIQDADQIEEGTELTPVKPSVDLSCSQDSDCGWYSLNGCSQDSGAIWRCGSTESAESLAEQLSASGSCSNIYVPKPRPETCGCVENSCKRVDTEKPGEKSLIKSDLLDALLTVEQFKVRFEYLSKASAKVGKYYQSTDKKEKAAVWLEASEDLIKGRDSLESVRVKIKSVKDAPTKDDIDAITREIDIVVKLLSIDELRIKRMLSD